MSGFNGKKHRSYSTSEFRSGWGGLGRVSRFAGSGRIGRAKISDSARRMSSASSSRPSLGGSRKPRRRLFEGVDQAKLAKVLTVGAFAIIGVIGLVLIIVSANSSGRQLEMTMLDEADTSGVITADDAGASIKLAFGGSIKLQDEVVTAAANGDSYDFNNYLSELRTVMTADLSIVSLVGSVDGNSGNANVSGFPKPNYPLQLAAALKTIGINHCATANSYSLAGGFDAMTTTIRNLAANDITAVGTYVSSETGNTVYVKRINSIPVGIGAYNCLTKAEYDKIIDEQRTAGITGDQLTFCINQLDLSTTRTEGGKSFSAASDAITADVKAMREAGAQFIIICINWGTASATKPVSEISNLAQRMVDLGVDVTMGSGSDVPQSVRIKTYQNSDGTTKNCYIFYSLGNLFSDCDSGSTQAKQESLVVNMTVEREAGSEKVTVTSAVYHPIFVNRDETNATENTYLKYRVLPAYKYYNATSESLPDVFSTAKQLSNCKTAVNDMKNLVNGVLALGQIDAATSDAGNTGGGDDVSL